MVFQCN